VHCDGEKVNKGADTFTKLYNSEKGRLFPNKSDNCFARVRLPDGFHKQPINKFVPNQNAYPAVNVSGIFNPGLVVKMFPLE
jgi:hypothetical protein